MFAGILSNRVSTAENWVLQQASSGPETLQYKEMSGNPSLICFSPFIILNTFKTGLNQAVHAKNNWIARGLACA